MLQDTLVYSKYSCIEVPNSKGVNYKNKCVYSIGQVANLKLSYMMLLQTTKTFASLIFCLEFDEFKCLMHTICLLPSLTPSPAPTTEARKPAEAAAVLESHRCAESVITLTINSDSRATTTCIEIRYVSLTVDPLIWGYDRAQLRRR